MPRIAKSKTTTPTIDQSAAIALLKAQLEKANAEVARLRPVSRTNMIDAGSMKIGPGDGEVTMDVGGEPKLIRPTIDIPDGPVPTDHLAELAFMEEEVEIEVFPSSDQYPEPCVSVWNNGRHQLFIRGQVQVVKRKFVEQLARCKPTSYSNVEFVDAEGNRRVKWPQRTYLKYPFAVRRDDNARGRAWLAKVLAQA